MCKLVIATLDAILTDAENELAVNMIILYLSNFDHSHVSNLLQRSKKVTNASLNSKWTCYSLMISFWWQQQRMALNKPSHFVWQWCRKTSLPQNSNGDWLKKRTTRFTVVLLKIAHYVCVCFSNQMRACCFCSLLHILNAKHLTLTGKFQIGL